LTPTSFDNATTQWHLDQPPSRLYAIHANLRDRVRAPLFDVPAALEVLGQGGVFDERAASSFPSFFFLFPLF
jgi:hypothetical protein